MGKVLLEEQSLIDIANSIRSKTGSEETMTPSEMATNIDNIEGLGDYYTETIKSGNGNGGGWLNTIKKIPSFINESTDCQYMFYGCPCAELDLSKINTSNVIYTSSMFRSCSNLTNLDLSNFDTSNVTSMGYMFYDCKKLTNLDLSNFDTSNVTNMSYMFSGCTGLTSLDLSNFDTSKVTDMGYMFQNYPLETIDLSNFRTPALKNINGMFNVVKLTNLDISHFDTSNVTNMGYLFNNCGQLVSLNMNVDMGKVISISTMFNYNRNLTNLTFGYNYGKGFTSTSANNSNYQLILSGATNLSHDSLMDVINKLYDLNLTYDVANGGTLRTQKLVLGSTNMAKLTADEIAIATAKGWTVS